MTPYASVSKNTIYFWKVCPLTCAEVPVLKTNTGLSVDSLEKCPKKNCKSNLKISEKIVLKTWYTLVKIFAYPYRYANTGYADFCLSPVSVFFERLPLWYYCFRPNFRFLTKTVYINCAVKFDNKRYNLYRIKYKRKSCSENGLNSSD